MTETDRLQSDKRGDEDVFTVRLPECGEYQMDVFRPKNEGGLEHVGTYSIVRREPSPEERAAMSKPVPNTAPSPKPELSSEEREKRQKEKELGMK